MKFYILLKIYFQKKKSMFKAITGEKSTPTLADSYRDWSLCVKDTWTVMGGTMVGTLGTARSATIISPIRSQT